MLPRIPRRYAPPYLLKPMWLQREKSRSFWKGAISGAYLAAMTFMAILIFGK